MLHRLLPISSLLLVACGMSLDAPDPAAPAGGGKTDTGWVSNTSYEIEGILESVVTHPAKGRWAELATSRELQEELIDTQLKFGKRALLNAGYELNQLSHKLRNIEVETNEGTVSLRYEAVVDVVKNNGPHTIPPASVADLPQTLFDVPLPADPVDVMGRVGERCAADWKPYTLRENNYYYYFRPQAQDCDLPLHQGRLSFEQIYPAKVVYPEYDRLLLSLPDTDKRGFRAALFPTLGDDDPASIHQGIKNMLETRLGLHGVDAADGTYRRYEWIKDQAQMVIDLYDPQRIYFRGTFRAALKSYELVYFAGHSEYGTKNLLLDESAFSPAYQIIMMWSCHSYAYYSRQVFRAKATELDPTGFDSADFVGTAPTPFFGDEDEGIQRLLSGLMEGIAAVSRGEDEKAPPWVKILGEMNKTSWDTPYGAAGVRSNSWQPATH